MDYVVYGTGYGATLMLLGYAIRTWGPGWRFRDGEEAAYDRREFLSARSSWRRFTSGLGATVATAGAALVLLTFILMMVRPSDGTGSTVALVMSGLLLLGVAVWAWLFFSRFGTWGVVATPEALTSYEPRTYDSRAAQTSAVATTGQSADPDEADGDDVVDDGDEDEPVLLTSEDEDSGEPDEEPEDGDADDAWFEAQYSKFESHHPDEDESIAEPRDVDEGDEEPIEEIEEYVEALTPDEVSDDIVDNADEEPVGEPDEPIESYEDLVRDSDGIDETTIDVDAVGDAARDAVEKDPLEVLPEAHADIAPLVEPGSEPQPQPDQDQDSGGREDALRRLRERQAERARQRATDDA